MYPFNVTSLPSKRGIVASGPLRNDTSREAQREEDGEEDGGTERYSDLRHLPRVDKTRGRGG